MSVAGAAAAADDPVPPNRDEPQSVDRVIVFGRTQTRDTQTLNQAELRQTVPGTSPLRVLDKLPGVSFQSADSLGNYEWSTRLTIRGFAQNQLGYTLDDVPLGDLSYANHNGLHISRAIIAENIRRTLLSQGTGPLDTASNSNLGGTVQFYSVDPADQFGVSLQQSFGSHDAWRTFAKLDSGKLAGGGKFFLSYVKQQANKWKGSGEQRQEQFNAKFVQSFGAHRLMAFVNYSDRQELDYQDLSKEMIGRLGYRWDNYYPDWQAAVDAARGIFRQGETSVDDAYYAGSGLRRDWLGGASLESRLGDGLRLKTTAYHHDNHGAGLWYTPYVASPTVPVSLRTTEYDIRRSGVLSALTAELGRHALNAGLWYETNRFTQARRFYAMQAGTPNRSPYDMPTDPMLTQWQYVFDYQVWQFHAQDTINIDDRLTVNAGFKTPSTRVRATTKAGPDRDGTIKASKPFLPQLGFTYAWTRDDELFGSVARNLRAFQHSVFSTTQAGFNAIKDNLKPETSTTYEFGWRHRQKTLESLLTVYHVDFRDRLLSIQQGPGIVGNPAVQANVGNVATNGAEASLIWTPTATWTWFGSVSYNRSEYRNDYVDNGVVVATRGKTVVDTPKLMAKTELAYDDGAWFGRIGANYLSKRYYTYLNDNPVAGHTLCNFAGGYRRKSVAMFREVVVQLSISNLLDRRYVSTLGSNGFVASDPAGTSQTLLAGAPREVFLTLSARY